MKTATEHFVEVNGVRLWIREQGVGPALILLHGWTLDQRMWNRQIQPLSEAFHVIAFDRRGCGRSTGTPDLALETVDLRELLDILHIDHATLCGASQGGRIALRFAVLHPECINALILVGTSLDGMPEPESDPGYIPIGEFAALARAGRMDAVRARWLSHPMMQVPGEDLELREQLAAMVADYRGMELLNPVPMDTIDVSGRLREIRAASLIIAGGCETPHRKAICARLRRELPNADYLEIEGHGHLVNMTAPQPFNAALTRFVRWRRELAG